MRALSAPARTSIPLDCLQSDIRAICGQFQIESPANQTSLRGAAHKGQIGRFEAAHVSIDADHVTRTSKQIRQDPGDHLFLLMQEYGTCEIRQSDSATLLYPGDMYLVDSTRASAFHYNGDLSHQISLHLPREEMVHRFGSACTGGLAIDRKDPLWLAMQAVLAKLMSTHNPASLSMQAEAFFSLMGAYLHGLPDRTSQNRQNQTAILGRALAIIGTTYHDPTFGPRELADKLNVSPRTLQRHFRQLDETPGKRLLNVRLEQAHAILASQTGREHSVASIAYHCGFNDLSHFYREFRKRYGKAPGTLIRSN